MGDYCEGVEVTITSTGNQYRLASLTTKETILLKRCLGDADGDTTASGQQDEVYNWDYGTRITPHLIKLVEATESPFTRICNSTDQYFQHKSSLDWCENDGPAGFYAPLIYDDATGNFEIFNQLNTIYSSTTPFRVFTTTGRLKRINEDSDIEHDGVFGKKVYYSISTGDDIAIDCETNTNTTTCTPSRKLLETETQPTTRLIPKSLLILVSTLLTLKRPISTSFTLPLVSAGPQSVLTVVCAIPPLVFANALRVILLMIALCRTLSLSSHLIMLACSVCVRSTNI